MYDSYSGWSLHAGVHNVSGVRDRHLLHAVYRATHGQIVSHVRLHHHGGRTARDVRYERTLRTAVDSHRTELDVLGVRVRVHSQEVQPDQIRGPDPVVTQWYPDRDR